MPRAKRKAVDLDDNAEDQILKAGSSSKKAKVEADVQEKRLARFKPRCPQNIAERVDRVVTQRFFMLGRTRNGDELREQFQVLGSTGNVYTVVISNLPSCDCPDASKGNHCKHILFVFLKVLSVPRNSPHYYQKALLSNELQEIFTAAPPAPNSIAPVELLKSYAKITGKETDESAAGPSNPPEAEDLRRIPEEGDDCPICYDTMDAEDLDKLAFCETCNKALHKECFQQWSRSVTPVTCVWCRSPWADTAVLATSSITGGVSSEGYLNLAGVAGMNPVRDTSSYYHGPKKGKRFYRW